MIKYVALFGLYVVIITSYFYLDLQKKYDVVKKNYEQEIELLYSGNIHTYEVLSDRFYGTYTDLMAKTLNRVNDASEKKREQIREELLEKLAKFFGELKLIGFNGMQIIDREGNSLLRLHKPYVYDDNVVKKRASLQRLQKDVLYQKGYEAGLFVMAYRFQYPLFYDGKFVGICEFSITPKSIIENLENKREYRVVTLYKKEYMQKVLAKSVLVKKYRKLHLLGGTFYYERREPLLPFEKFDWIAGSQTDVLSYYHNLKWHIVAVLPVSDILGKHIGYIFIDKVDPIYMSLIEDILKIYLLFLFVGFFVLYFYLKQRRILEYNRELINLQNDILIITDGEKILDTNRKMLDFFGYKDLEDFMKEHDCICDFFLKESGYLYKEMDSLNWIEYIKKHKDSQIVVKMYNKKREKEEIFAVEYLPFKDEEKFFLIFKEITEQFYKEKELLDMAYIDALTHIQNRRSFDELLAFEYEKSTKTKSPLSLIMFDIDYFKRVNDTYGHDAGDVILQELSRLILSKIRKNDIFARWGGEEFMILLELDLEAAKKLADKLRYEVEHFDFSIVEHVTISLGVVELKEAEKIEDLLSRVDESLYKAKENGRNRVESL